MSELTRQELIEYCDAHDLKYHGNAGVNTLKAIVDEHMAADASDDDEAPDVTPASQMAPSETESAKAEPESEPKAPMKGKSFKNVGKSRHMVDGKVLMPDESITLSEKQTANDRLMAKIKTGVRCGNLKAV